MSLSKASVPVVFHGGLDQKTDPKISVPGKFANLNNCIRKKDGRIEKREGLSSIGQPTSTGGERIVGFNDTPVMMGSTGAASYLNSAWATQSGGASYLSSKSFDTAPVFRNRGIQTSVDCASGGGTTMFVFHDRVATRIKYSLVDDTTGSVISTATIADNSVRQDYPRVSYVGGHYVVLYVEFVSGTQQNLKGVTITTAGVVSAASTILTTVVAAAADALLDTCVLGSNVYFAYPNQSKGYTVGYVNSSLALQGSSATTSATSVATGAIAVAANTAKNTVYVVYYDSNTASSVLGRVYTATLSANADFLVDSAARVKALGMCFSTSGNNGYVFFETSAFAPSDTGSAKAAYVQYETVTTTWVGSGTAPAVTAFATFARSVGMYSKPFYYNSMPHCVVAYESALQSAYYLMNTASVMPLSQVALGNGGGIFNRSRAIDTIECVPCSVAVDAAGKYVLGIQDRTRAATASSGFIVSTIAMGIDRLRFDLTSANKRNYAALGKSLYFAGGIPAIWDGLNGCEYGFTTYPENVTMIVSSPGTTSLVAGAHSYRAIYEWTDAQGQVYRSAPSATVSATVGPTDDVFISVPTLRLTGKGSDVRIVIFASAANGSVFYRHVTLANDTTADTISYSPTTEAITTNEILYTTGGTVDNTMMPACTVVRAHRNRLWAGGLEKSQLAYTREYVSGEPAQFSDVLIMPIEEEGGAVTALGSLDDKLLIFKKRHIYYTYGEGPLDSGLQSDYPTPQILSHDVGCSDPNLVVEGPFGVIFKSEKGFYEVNRGLALNYVGKDVEDYNSLTFTGVVLLADRNEVRFLTASGTCLVYNYYYKQWSTFTSTGTYYGGDSAAYINGVFYIHEGVAGLARKEVAGSYGDNGAAYSMTIETSWLSMAGLQGFQRCYSFELLGDLISNHYTQVSFAYDFETTYNETITYDTRQLTTNIYQVEYRPRRQKCDAIKLKIVDSDAIGVTPGASFNMVAVTAVVGRKMGSNRLPATRKA